MVRINTLLLFWGRKGGGAKYSLEIAKELSLRDDVNLHLSVSNQCEIIDQFRNLSKPGLYINTHGSVFGFLFKWFIGRFKLVSNLTAYLKQNKIDVVLIGMDFFWGALIQKAANAAGAKTILVVHEPVPHPLESFFISLFKRITLPGSLKGADHLVALTNHVREVIIEKYEVDGDKISVIPHGIFSYHKATEPRRLNTKSRVKLLFFGRIEYYKGLDILLEAFLSLERDDEPVFLDIWGAGDLSGYRDLLNRIQNVHIENRWLNESEIQHIFKESQVCILPYREASQSGIVGIASSAALPVIACPNEGLTEQLRECGSIISNDFTPEALASSIRKLIHDPGLYESLSKKSLDYANTLSWLQISSEFIEIGYELGGSQAYSDG